MVLSNWYTSVELRQDTVEWEEITTSFTHTFSFANISMMIDSARQVIRTNIFEGISIPMSSFPQRNAIVQNQMECYKIIGELDYYDPCDIHIPKYEGS